MFRPQQLHQLPSLGICAHRCTRMPTLPCCTNVATKHVHGRVDCGPRALQKLHPSWLAAVLLLDAGSALKKRRTSNVSPSTITSAP